MQIEAIYDQGNLEFISPVKLKSGRVRVKVVIPDEEVEESPSPDAQSYELSEDLRLQAREMLVRLRNVRENALREANQREISQKEKDRMEAFDLRARMREEQGRPS